MLGDGRYGFLTADFTPAKVAAQIQRAVRYPGIRRAIAERASSYVRETYDIARMVDAHRQMYLQLQGTAS
jgi:glycosyltransferase involved in cell wall biosynthesis